MHTDFGSTGSQSILLASARGLFRMYSPPKLAGKYFIVFLAEPLVIANTDLVKQQPWFQVQKDQKLRDHMFAAERNLKTLIVNALPGGVFSHVEDYTPLAG